MYTLNITFNIHNNECSVLTESFSLLVEKKLTDSKLKKLILDKSSFDSKKYQIVKEELSTNVSNIKYWIQTIKK